DKQSEWEMRWQFVVTDSSDLISGFLHALQGVRAVLKDPSTSHVAHFDHGDPEYRPAHNWQGAAQARQFAYRRSRWRRNRHSSLLFPEPGRKHPRQWSRE